MAAAAVFEVLDAEPVGGQTGRQPFPDRWRNLTMHEVSFAYEQNPGPVWVLRNLDLQIRQGEFLVVQGPNGSGKSTLVQLLARFDLPERGRIEVDGVDYRDIAPDMLRRRIVLADGEATIFNLSVRENVAFGQDPDQIDSKRLARALDAVGATELVDSLPQGDRTLLGHAGSRLSTGQRQLLALARVAYFEHEVVLLDEPARGLDRVHREKFAAILKAWRGKRTVVLVTHDTELARLGDRRVFLEDGRIRELSLAAEG
jgi:ABC-type bacteriocin/lantibiotic exporter with double-glycine peptidase domain